MKTWTAKAQINGEDVSYYPEITFSITEALYNKIQSAINKEIPLHEYKFYSDLVRRAENELTKQLPYILDFESLYEKPDPEDYDLDDPDELADFNDAIQAYEEHFEDPWEDFCLESMNIYDPSEELCFKKQFIGRTFEQYADGEEYSMEFTFENDENCQTFTVEVAFSSDGTVTDLEITESVGMECDDVRSSSWDDCDPDYDFISESLEEVLSEDKEEW